MISCGESPLCHGAEAVLPGGARLSDYLSVGVIAQIFPLPAVRARLMSAAGAANDSGRCGRWCTTIALGLFRSEVLRCLVDLRWMASSMPVQVSGKSSISRARTEPFQALCRASVELVAEQQTRGAYRSLRLVAFRFDAGRRMRQRTARSSGCPAPDVAKRRQVRLTALVEVGTRVAFGWHRGVAGIGSRAGRGVARPSEPGCWCWRIGTTSGSRSGSGRPRPAPSCCGG